RRANRAPAPSCNTRHTHYAWNRLSKSPRGTRVSSNATGGRDAILRPMYQAALRNTVCCGVMAFLAGTMCTAVDAMLVSYAIAEGYGSTVRADRSHVMNGAFETIENAATTLMGYVKQFVVFVGTNNTGCHDGTSKNC